MTKTDTLSRASLPSQIKERLLAQITSGALKPGDRLIELKIAAEMDTSQAPVREALRELEAIGVVETRRNKGARVRILTNDELRDIYDVRAELEGFASELAAKNSRGLQEILSKVLTSMNDAAGKNDALAFAHQNTVFHRTIVEASGNSVLLDHWERLDVQFRTAINVTRGEMDLLEATESHQEIIEAIVSQNGPASRLAARDHVLTNKPPVLAN